jgi:tRNA (guanine37-N1)-methyltransferase
MIGGERTEGRETFFEMIHIFHDGPFNLMSKSPSSMQVDVVTLFPEMFAPVIGLSIIGRAVERGLVEVRLHNPLDVLQSGERADAPPYGGGAGMVMRLEPLAAILDRLLAEVAPEERRLLVMTSPAGEPFTQAAARRFSAYDRLILICGRYEGIDDRIRELYPCEEFTVGDFVVTGGELPALLMLDATVRLLAGAITPGSLEGESFGEAGLGPPSYTRPPQFRGVDVPAVLLSGDHAAIAEFRRARSRERTARRRPDLNS